MDRRRGHNLLTSINRLAPCYGNFYLLSFLFIYHFLFLPAYRMGMIRSAAIEDTTMATHITEAA